MVAMTEYHRSSGLNNRNKFSHSSGGWKSKIKVSTGLVSPEASSLGLQIVTFSLYPHLVFPLCLLIPGISLCAQISSSYKDTSQVKLVPILTASF